MAQSVGGNPFGPNVGQEDQGLSQVKRTRKQAWRALHRRVRAAQSAGQKLYRDSQKIAEQSGMITSKQFSTFARKVTAYESAVISMQSDLKVVANVIGLFY
jgi:hypothetical protein